MPSIEAPQEVNIAEDIKGKKREILTGPPSSNYMHRQIQLIFDLACKKQSGMINSEQLEAFAASWTGSNLSKAFSDIAHNPEFETHDRFRNDIANIRLEDVEYFAETGKMPD